MATHHDATLDAPARATTANRDSAVSAGAAAR